jgi:hypothetical protein
VQTSVQGYFHVYPWQGDLITGPACVSQGVTGPGVRTVFSFLGKPLHVKVASYRVQVAASGSKLHSHIGLEHARPVFEKVLDLGESCWDQKSAPLSRSDMFSIISISIISYTLLQPQETPHELQNTFFSLTYDPPSAAFPLPGALSNFPFHFSSCLNNITASNALGAPCSGSAPPSSKAYLYQHLSFRPSD